MVGIVVDAQRMHVTKQDWSEGLLPQLKELTGKRVVEFHTRHFYAGKPPFDGVPGETRAQIISTIVGWLTLRRHEVVYASVVKASYEAACHTTGIPLELRSIWRFLGFHILLAMQSYSKNEKRNKGHTQYVFDNEDTERVHFPDLVRDPKAWSDDYYRRDPKKRRLDQIIDAPLFGDSIDFPLIQCADLVAYLLRRYAEIAGGDSERYAGEQQRVAGWVEEVMKSAIPRAHIYRKIGRTFAESLFYDHAPEPIRALGK